MMHGQQNVKSFSVFRLKF